MSAIGSGASPQLADHSRLGRTVVLSAMLPLDASGRVVAGGIREQTRRALERLRDAATRAGVSIERAAAVHVYLRDAADFAAMNEAYAPFFPVDPPTRTTVVAPPADPAALVSIAATVIPDDQPRDVDPSGGVEALGESVQLRDPQRRHAVAGRPGLAARVGRQRHRRRRRRADAGDPRQRPRPARRRRVLVRRRGRGARLHLRRGRLRER